VSGGAVARWAVLVYSGAVRLARVVFRRRLRVLGGSPAAARRWLSAWRAFQAVRIRWLRTACRQASQNASGVRPMSQPAAGDGVAGGVLDRGEASFGAGAAGVGAAVRGGGVVVLLPGFRRDAGWDGEGLLGAAGGRVLGGNEDLSWANLVRTGPAVAVVEGFPQVVGQGVGRGDGVRAGLDLNGAVAAGGAYELAD
jgi:hypothetical protein